MTILAIDQGTTSTRALCVDEHGHLEISRVLHHRQYYPRPGWVEHDPEELIRNIEDCIAGSYGIDINGARVNHIDAMGIDNQGESCLAWHADSGQAICPVIVWQDNRTEPVIEKLKREGHEARILEISGLPLDAYFSASKLAWIVEHYPEARQLLKQGKLRLGTTDAFFLDRLANRFVTDITTASRTSLLNLQTGNWDQELCQLFGVPVEALPEIVDTTGELGTVVSRGDSGRDRQIPVTASVVDQQASLYGHGCRNSGDSKITFGTGAFALMVTGSELARSPEQGLLPTIAWQFEGSKPVYALDGGVYCAGSAINWGRDLGLFDRYEDINHFEKSPAIETRACVCSGTVRVSLSALGQASCWRMDRHVA